MNQKCFFLLLLSFYIVNCTLTIEAQATIRYVSKTGTSTPPYTSWQTAADSIQKCINICSFGDTVYVANGVYKENLVINTAISLIGSSMDSTMIDGTRLTDYTVAFNSDGSIENFNIYGRGETYSSGRAIRSNNLQIKLIVKNCQLSKTGVGVSMAGGDLVAEKLIIKEVIRGFNLFGENNNSISECVIIINKNNSIGISIGYAPNVDNYIIGNTILFTGTNNMESGISVDAPKSVFINNNLISGFNYNIWIQIHIDSVIIKNNLLMNKSGIGLAGVRSINEEAIVSNVILKNNRTGLSGFPIISNYNLFWENESNYEGVPGDSDIIADPMFVNDTIPMTNGNYDFHLQKYSPAIDKGDPNILDVDGSRSDIGMYGGPFGETYTYQDLAPLAPRNLSAVVDTNTITVKWKRNTEADTAFYSVYRDTVSGFTVDSTKLVSTSADSFFVQSNPHLNIKYVYKITCVDKQGNVSKPSIELVVNITSVSTNEYPMTISDYLLYQNYPNPFNPSTKIGYQLKQRAYVKLMVYDITGELITVLVNKEQNAGYYETEFNVGNGLPSVQNIASGIYLYRIEVIGEGRIPVYTEMKKMLMLK